MKTIKKSLMKYAFVLGYISAISLIIVTGKQSSLVTTANSNRAKSLKTNYITAKKETYKTISSIGEISQYSKEYLIKFKGTLTGYGPDCAGCIGVVYCKPNPNVTNGNIYYNDKEYGRVRIVAADYAIPCGSIVKIENFKFVEGGTLYAIVLDRGSAIVGLTMDLLYNNEKETNRIGRNYNISFTIERWGWTDGRK